jgi:neutral ceramidase
MSLHWRTPFHAWGVAFVLLAVVVPGTPAKEPATEWKVGLARVKITPDQPVFLSGYGSRNKPFDKVTADLYAKALALEDADGRLAVLVTTDLLGLPAAIAEPVCARLAEKAGLKRAQILLASSHIHTGPALSLKATAAGGQSSGDAQRTIAYTRRLQDQLVEVVVQAMKKRTPARLSWGSGVAHFVMNRRQHTPRGVILGMNARGPADRTVPVLRIDDPNGKLRAVLFGAATHNTTLTGSCYEVCGDYAGFAQAHVEEHHPGVQAMFVLGFAGDSDPYPRGTMELARRHGATLGEEVKRVLETKLQPIRGPLRVALSTAALPLQPPPSRSELEKQAKARSGLDASIARQMLAVVNKGDKLPDHYACPVAIWQLGNELTLVALSGEVVVDYVALLDKALGPNRLWLAADSNDLFGYLPSARVLEEGGYETRGLYAGGIGRFSPRAQDVLVEKVRELAGQVGRALPERKPQGRGNH